MLSIEKNHTESKVEELKSESNTGMETKIESDSDILQSKYAPDQFIVGRINNNNCIWDSLKVKHQLYVLIPFYIRFTEKHRLDGS